MTTGQQATLDEPNAASGSRTPDAEPRADRALRVMFLMTTMPVGGAETLLVSLVRRFDRSRIEPEICCLKQRDTLGTEMAEELPVFDRLLANKFDIRVLGRLTRLLRERRIDAVVTVGAGDKMFWGRLAAKRAGVPVALCALHTTGGRDGFYQLNRWLAPEADGYIAVGEQHAEHMAEVDRLPADRIMVISNGVDTDRFCPKPPNEALRAQLGLPPGAPVVGIVAALRPEKNHGLFLDAAALVRRQVSTAEFLLIGDGPERVAIETRAAELGLQGCVHLLGNRPDVPDLLGLMNVVTLSSRREANPVSLLEAMSCERPIVAPRLGCIPEILAGDVGSVVEPHDAAALADAIGAVLRDPEHGAEARRQGRLRVIRDWSLTSMVEGYEELIRTTYDRKTRNGRTRGP